MQSIKGFVGIQSLVGKNLATVYPLGELSTYSLTFSRSFGEYSDSAIPGYQLHTAASVDSVAGSIPLTQAQATHILTVAKWFETYAAGKTGTYSKVALLNAALTQFQSNTNTWSAGDLATNGDQYLPEWIQWTNTDGNGSTIKIWFSDTAFQNEYDGFEIVVIPPVNAVDDFFKDTATLQAEIAAFTPVKAIEKVNTARGKVPETVLRVKNFLYTAPTFPNTQISTDWYVLVYGAAGDNDDQIKAALIAYIRAHTTHTDAEWAAILPDLWKSTEFVVIPRWDLVAIPDLTSNAGLYLPAVKPADAIAKAITYSDYDATNVNANLEIVASYYKSLMLEIVGGPYNRNAKSQFTDYFGDYIAENTSSNDFDRMSKYTQDWSYLISSVLAVAETATTTSSGLPSNMAKTVRNGKLYISVVYDNVEYLVLAKSSFTS
jgi:hypothetical protein